MQKVRRTGGARAGGFPGATQILAQLEGGTSAIGRKRVGLIALERIPVREHTELQDTNGNRLGEVTSGLLGPTIDKPIAMGYVPPAFAAVGTRINAMAVSYTHLDVYKRQFLHILQALGGADTGVVNQNVD